jgi:phenylacetate-coenzyme A ligase PaaK-like adenylate-forming protein
MIWQYFLNELKKEDIKLDLSDSILIHGGGWKKLESEKITRDQFRQALYDSCSISDIHDYYGMVEQTGCIYMECEYGHLHTSVFSDVIIRRPDDFSIADVGETGIIEVVSSIPESYPGHVLLTEDIGRIVYDDGCKCGRKGKCFEIHGRIRHAELRGCSDTYAAEHG